MTQEAPLAIVCGGGTLPFAVADAVRKRGRRAVLIAIRGWADAEAVAGYPHHWIALGQLASVLRCMRAEGCRDIVFIGVVRRPSITQLRLDFTTLRMLPRIMRMFRGGDNHLLTGASRILEEYGLRIVGPHEVAPEILMPDGALGRRGPNEAERADIARGLALLDAMGPFDVGQAVVVADQHVLAVEAAEGTDRMLAHVAELRGHGGASRGVLVKAPKPGQDWRFDLPSIGPRTIEGAASARLAGIAVRAGGAIVAEPQRVAALADERNVFVVGVRADGTSA